MAFKVFLGTLAALALVLGEHVPETLGDECEGECSLEMLHLRARKLSQERGRGAFSEKERERESFHNW